MSANGRMRWGQFSLGQVLTVLTLCGALLGFREFNSRELVPCRTGRDLDLAILGRGFFQVIDPATGTFKYTRHGHFSLNANGDIVLELLNDAFVLQPQITVPDDWTQFVVHRDGLVTVQRGGAPQLAAYGQLQVVRFANDDGLRETESGLYEETDASGVAMLAAPGSSGAGVVMQGWLNGTPGWSTLLADARLHFWLLAALTSTVVWLAIEVRRQRWMLAELRAGWFAKPVNAATTNRSAILPRRERLG